MIRRLAFSVVLSLVSVAFVRGGEPAATTELPAGLKAIGVRATDVVSRQQAQLVRGQGGDDDHSGGGGGSGSTLLILEQYKSFTLSGATLGSGSSVNLLEGLIGQLNSTSTSSGSTTTFQAIFGGLAGNVQSQGGNLSFNLAGKSLQETLNLQGGVFNQSFNQVYRLFK